MTSNDLIKHGEPEDMAGWEGWEDEETEVTYCPLCGDKVFEYATGVYRCADLSCDFDSDDHEFSL